MKKTLKRVFAVVMAMCIVMMYSVTAMAVQSGGGQHPPKPTIIVAQSGETVSEVDAGSSVDVELKDIPKPGNKVWTVSPENAVKFNNQGESKRNITISNDLKDGEPITISVKDRKNGDTIASTTITVRNTTYTVSFDVGNNGTAPENQSVSKNNKARKPNDPTAEGYRFDGWYSEADCTNAFDFNTAITQDTTVYGKWVKTWTVEYDVADKCEAPASVNVDDGATTSAPSPEPSNDDYSFKGWHSDSECTSIFDFTTAITENIKLYAKWVEKVNVIFKSDGEVYNTEKVAKGDTVTEPEKQPTKDDYAFKGWYSDDACETPFDFTTVINEETTLYAKWVPVYTVTFDGNTGTFENKKTTINVTVEEGETVSAPVDHPLKNKNVFAGWYTESACENAYDFTTTVDESFTLYAKWEPSYDAYLYGRIPCEGLEWYGLGITKVIKAGNGNDNDKNAANAADTYQVVEDSAYVRKTLYPAINIDGVSYTKAEADNPAADTYVLTPFDDTDDNSVSNHTYNGIVLSYGADKGSKNGYNTPETAGNIPTYHVNYNIALYKGYTVEYYYDGELGDAPANAATSGVAECHTTTEFEAADSVSVNGKGYLLDNIAQTAIVCTPVVAGTEIKMASVSEDNTNTVRVYYVSADQVTYDANSGTGSMDPTVGKTGEEVSLSSNTFTKDGYHFAGWYADANCTGEAITKYTLTEADDVVYAKWEQDKQLEPTTPSVVPGNTGSDTVVDPEGSEPPVPAEPEEDEITGDAPGSDALGAGSETIDSDAMGDPDAIEDDEEDDVDADALGTKTGDTTDMVPWAVGFAAAIIALGAALVLRRREN